MRISETRMWFSWKGLLWIPAIGFLFWAVRKAPFNEIGGLMATLKPGYLFLLIFLNLAIVLGFSGRWKLILNSMGEKIPLVRLVLYRLAGFSVSYFTPGTQFGGEPLQVFLLARNHLVARNDAVSSVYLDKLIELIVNYSFLLAGLLITLGYGLFKAEIHPFISTVVAAIGLSPLAYFFLLWKRLQPASKAVSWLSRSFPQSGFLEKAARLVHESEERIRILIHENPGLLFRSIGVSIVVWALMILEFHLMWIIIGQPLQLIDTVFAMTLARIAFLLPLPGGLGALEASQILVMQVLGHNPAYGIAACLLIRARDISFGAIGFLAANWFIQTEKIKAQ